ncbi:MAG: T9SS type B sorting domain-containing protein [Chitinophagales bacterium]|nr:T9SS type B sorting domain-containing protein [Chitinophagales bacterium]
MICFLFTAQIYAQSGLCDPGTPFFVVDLSNSPDSVYVSPVTSRSNQCCGLSNPFVCVEFEIHLHPQTSGVNFGIFSGAIPPGSLSYQVNCGPAVSVGEPICLSGPGPHILTFCKPGGNANEYFISAIPILPLAPDINLTENCDLTISVEGLNPDSTITWRDITPGSGGMYTSYFSCTSGCDTTTISSPPNPPAFIEYEVCGWVNDTVCNLVFYNCDTGRVSIVTPVISAVTNDPQCNNFDNADIDISVNNIPGPLTYQWSNGDTTEDIDSLTAGSYIVTVSGYLGCQYSDTFSLIGPQPLLIDSNITHVSCSGLSDGSIDITVSGGVPPYEFIWSTGDTTEDIYGLSAGSYFLTVIGADSCISTTNGILINDIGLAIVLNSMNHVSCSGFNDGSIDIGTIGGSGPIAYNWSNGMTTEDISSLSPGLYSVIVMDSLGCSDTSSIWLISQPTPLVVNIDTIQNLTCPSSNQAVLYAQVSGGVMPYNYIWSNGQSNDTISNLNEGSYTVTITDLNGCIETDTATISPQSNVSVFVNGTNIQCNGMANGSAVVSVNNSLGYTVNWSNGQATDTITGLSSGSYMVTVSDTSGCVILDTIQITEPLPIGNQSSQADPSCFSFSDGSIQLQPSGGTPAYSVNWSNGSTQQNIQNLSAGSYQVTISDANGCLDTDTIILVDPLPVFLSIQPQSPTCYNIQNGEVTTIVSGGTMPYTYSWSNGSNNSDIFDLGSGQYTVTVSDANQCSTASTATLSSPDTPTVGVYPSYSQLFMGDSDTFQVSHNFNSSNLSYSWTPTMGLNCSDCQTVIANPFTSTLYTYTVSNITDPDNPCSVSGQLYIEVDPNHRYFIPNVFTPNGDGENDMFTVYGVNIIEFHIQIFNRLGIKVFETSDIDKGWNGTYKGEMQNPGVYVYDVTLGHVNGEQSHIGGSVTIVR